MGFILINKSALSNKKAWVEKKNNFQSKENLFYFLARNLIFLMHIAKVY